MSQPDRTDIERIQRLLGDRYQLSWIIGRGGMSTVWLAWDKDEERDVAVKILKPEYTENDEFRNRFRNEAEASEEFRSDNVVATYDYGEVRDDNGAMFCFIIMEYVRGESLADVLSREGSLPESLALDVTTQVARGLQTIHEAGLVHRDIKPGNLLITPQGVVKITDFGIAKAAAAVPLTRTGMVVGTAQYVSPEQAQGQSVHAASDIYSLGVVAYEMVAGHRPFSGDSTVSVAIKHISEAPPALSDSISGPMRELIGICLRKDPQARYENGGELAAATEYVHNGQRPPQPHLVPADDVVVHPRTEHLGAVAQGTGTNVPPEQGPQPSAAVAARMADSDRASSSSRRKGAAAVAATSRDSEKSSGAGRGILVGLGLAALLALGVIGYVLASSQDDGNPSPSQPSVTEEESTEESTEPETPTTVTETEIYDPGTEFYEPDTSEEEPSEPDTTTEHPSEPEPTSEQPSDPGFSEPSDLPPMESQPQSSPGDNGAANSGNENAGPGNNSGNGGAPNANADNASINNYAGGGGTGGTSPGEMIAANG